MLATMQRIAANKPFSPDLNAYATEAPLPPEFDGLADGSSLPERIMAPFAGALRGGLGGFVAGAAIGTHVLGGVGALLGMSIAVPAMSLLGFIEGFKAPPSE